MYAFSFFRRNFKLGNERSWIFGFEICRRFHTIFLGAKCIYLEENHFYIIKAIYKLSKVLSMSFKYPAFVTPRKDAGNMGNNSSLIDWLVLLFMYQDYKADQQVNDKLDSLLGRRGGSFLLYGVRQFGHRSGDIALLCDLLGSIMGNEIEEVVYRSTV
jgi:hypothetical protein